MSKNDSISMSVIKRLPRYYRFLGELKNQGIKRISSRELSQRMNLTASQIRQDLNCFGGFGQQGYGYNVDELRAEIGRILGVDRRFGTILVGAGNLGRAIAAHINFEAMGCKLIGIFDNDISLKGKTVGGIEIMHDNEMRGFCERNRPTTAILCIPKSEAQRIADILVDIGVKAFWNFSHCELTFDDMERIAVENVHLSDSLLTLTYRTAILCDGDEKESRNSLI